MKKWETKRISIFDSMESENAAEHKRLAMMTPEERLQEFAVLQKRVWGEKWPNIKMKKVVSWEKVDW